MHDEGGNRVLVVQVRLSEVDVHFLNNWVQVALLVQLKGGAHVDAEVLEYQLYRTVIRNEPEVDVLLSADLPVLEGGELEFQEALVVVAHQVHLDVGDVEVCVRVGDVFPVNLPLQNIKEEAKFVVVGVRQLEIEINVVRQELLHGVLERVHGRLLQSQQHTRVHVRDVLGGDRLVAPVREEGLGEEEADEELGEDLFILLPDERHIFCPV